jgi:hypothetical protein
MQPRQRCDIPVPSRHLSFRCTLLDTGPRPSPAWRRTARAAGVRLLLGWFGSCGDDFQGHGFGLGLVRQVPDQTCRRGTTGSSHLLLAHRTGRRSPKGVPWEYAEKACGDVQVFLFPAFRGQLHVLYVSYSRLALAVLGSFCRPISALSLSRYRDPYTRDCSRQCCTLARA